MAWPSQVTAGQAILASQFNAVVTAQQVWGGAASAAGYALTDLPSVGLHTTNASWQEFQFIATAGATQANDTLFLQYNARTSSGGADSWNSVATIAVGNGAVTFYAGVAFYAAVAVNAQMTFNTGVNLNGQTLLGNAAFIGAITFASTLACYSSLGLRSANASWQEFQIVASAGGSQSTDVLNLQWNARTSSGGSDSWSSFASVAVASGAVSFVSAVTFNGAINFNAALTLNAGINLNNQTLSGNTTFSGGVTFSAIPTVSSTLYFGTNNFALQVQPGTSFVFYAYYGGNFNNVGTIAAATGNWAFNNPVSVTSLNITNPANVSFGSNWQVWNPTISASGSMTVSGVTMYLAQYIRMGPSILFRLDFTATLGGTANNTVYATLPVNQIDSGVCPQSAWAAYTLILGATQGPNCLFFNQNFANFALGTYEFRMTGIVRVA